MAKTTTSSGLSKASEALFDKLQAEYDIRDSGGVEILRSGLRALDQAMAAESAIGEQGQVTTDRFGQLRAHPLLPVARDFRAQYVAAIKALNLSIGEPAKLGRPTSCNVNRAPARRWCSRRACSTAYLMTITTRCLAKMPTLSPSST